jgi:pimeloyl-ACP methyl ester carboxylesterase
LSDQKRVAKPVVFFQHGLLDSADCWISHDQRRATAFQASDNNFDVWLGNSRGNKYSKLLTETIVPDGKKKVADPKYWDFSFQEMGEYDVPANVDYITKVTGVEKITYVGHSQGTSQMYYALATNEDHLSTKVNLFVALGPVMRLTNCRSK